MRAFTCAIALAVFACAPSNRPALPASECVYTSDCGAAQICSAAGRCVPQCAADRDCAAGQKCTSGACTLPPGHCLRDSDCGAGQVCGASGLCGSTCASSSQCGAGFVCLGNTCVAQQPECTRDADCGAGRVCTSSQTCAQSCTAATQCNAAQTCSAGTCVSAPPQCSTSADCTAPQVCRQTRCVAQCTADQDCSAGQRCQSGTCQLLPAQCLRNSDCPVNKSCISGSCVDACVASRDCPAGNVCNLGLCVLPSPQCAVATDCASGQACSPAGQCVTACTTTANCSGASVCSNGACVSNGPDTATVGGSATYAGQSNSAGIVVKLSGPGYAQATTDATGAYSFLGLPPGLYAVTITAAFSAEGTITTQVTAKAGATTTIPVVTFSPRGEVKGVATLSGQSSSLGINVFVVGSSRGTTTDASGNYDLTGVPVGSQQVIASYPGYNAASANVTVTTGAVTTVPALTLTQQVVSNSGVFAFQSTPPLTVVQNHAYSYTAVAAGAGITGVTYSLAAGPAGMTVNATSGAVAFTPTYLASFTVAIAASGGGANIYQVYNLQVLSQLQQQLASPSAVRDGDAGGGVTWVVDNGAVTSFAGSTVTNFDVTTPQRSAKTTSVTLGNIGNVTGYSYPGGKVTSLAAAAGTFGATWPGGTVPAAGPTVANSIPIASARLEGGTVKAVSVPGSVNATGIAYATGTASSITANKLIPSSVGVADPTTTGIVPANGLTRTTLTDSTQNWTTAVAGQCITNSSLSNWFLIASSPAPTATTLTISSGDLTTILGINERYFVVPCGAYLTYRVAFPASTQNFTGLPGVDAYLSGAFFSTLNSSFAGTADSFTFSASILQYSAIVELQTTGFILAPQAGGYHLVTFNDSNVTGATTGRIGAPGFAGTYVVDSSSGTGKVVAQVPLGTDITPLLSRATYVLADGTTGLVSATLNATGLVASPGQFIWNDSVGIGYSVLTAIPLTIGVPPQDLTAAWAGALVVPTAGPAGKNPNIVVTDLTGGFTPGAFVGRRFLSRLNSIPSGSINANDATTVTWAGDDCATYFYCPGRLQAVLGPAFAGSGWAAAASGNRIRVDLTAQSAWSATADSLVGRVLMPKNNFAAQGTIALNQGTLAVVGVGSFPAADAFSALSGGQLVYLADGSNPFGTPTLSVSITPDVAPGWTANAWVGSQLIAANGSLVGQIIANTTTTVTVSANINAIGSLVAGQQFAFGLVNSSPSCPTGLITVTATLTGMNFIAGNYDTLIAGSLNAPVVSNTPNGAVLTICYYYFPSLLTAIGSTGTLSSNGLVPVVLTDTSAAFTAGAFKGYSVRPAALAYQNTFPTVADNGPQSISFDINAYSGYLLASFAAGTSYVLVDPMGYVQLRVTTDATLTPGALAGTFVHGLAVNNAYGYPIPSDQPILVTANDASSITSNLTTNGFGGEFAAFIASPWQALQFSAGAVLNLADTSASFTPGALVGQTVQFGGRNLLVTSNTAQGIVVASSDSLAAVPPPAAASPYVIPPKLAGPNRVRALADGTAWVGLGNVNSYPVPVPNGTQAAVARIGASGPGALYTPLTTGKQVQVTARQTLHGTYAGLTNQGLFTQITDTTASWTPNALAGAAVSLRGFYGGWSSFTVMSNTATTLQIYSNGPIAPDVTQVYVIDPMRVDVAGGGLVAHAYAGGRLWLQGVIYQVRDNDAGSLLLLRATAAPGIAPTGTGGAPGWLLTGLRGNRVNGIAPNGSGFAAVTDDGIALFDGANWTHLGLSETSKQLATGTISDFTATSVTCTACNFTAGAFAGAQLMLADGPRVIGGNSAHVISLLAPITMDRPPLLGDTFAIIDGRGLASEATDVAYDGGTAWVTSAAGLLKGVSGSWSLLTSADGLPAAGLVAAGVRVPGELWVASSGAGVARLSAGTWQQFTAAGTESSPGKRDGLPGDSIVRISFDGSNTWFAGLGASSFNGTTWNATPSLLLGSVNVVVIPSPGVAWFGTAAGLFSVTP